MPIEVKTETIECAGGMPALVAELTGAGPHPVVVLLHERYGLVQHTRDQAARCARDGFAVIAPNMFFRHPDQDALAAGDARCDLSDPDAVAFIHAAVEAMRGRPAADTERLAVAGYCQTGRHPLAYAAERPLAAVVVWYGAAGRKDWPASDIHPKPLEEIIARVDAPVFGAFGEADHIISVEDVRRFRGALETSGVGYDIRIHRDAPHGWLNDTMPGRYRKPQAEAAWADQQAFLARVLAPDYDPTRVETRYRSDVARDYDFSRNKRLA